MNWFIATLIAVAMLIVGFLIAGKGGAVAGMHMAICWFALIAGEGGGWGDSDRGGMSS
jgi:hypothetical protein